MSDEDLEFEPIYCFSCRDSRIDPHFGDVCPECRDEPEFVLIYCTACQDSRLDPHFGDVCPKCKTAPADPVEKLLAETLPGITESNPLMIKLKQNRITTPELRSELNFFHSAIEKCFKQQTGWRKSLNSALWGSASAHADDLLAFLDESIDRAIKTKERKREQELHNSKKRLHEIESQKADFQRKAETKEQRRIIYLEREQTRNIERVKIMREKCRVEPLTEFPGWDSPWRSRCLECNDEVFPRFSTVRISGWACNPCARKRFDDLKAASQHDERARLMEEIGGVIPLEPYLRSQSPWKCECKTCGSIVTPRFDDVINKHRRACIFCSRNEERVFAFDFKAPGIIYLLEHLDLGAIKVGISTTASKTDRIGQHELNGWTRINVWSVTTGFVAREVEQEILGWWRNELKLLPGCTASDMPQGGHTETVSIIAIDTYEVIERIEQVISLSGNKKIPLIQTLFDPPNRSN